MTRAANTAAAFALCLLAAAACGRSDHAAEPPAAAPIDSPKEPLVPPPPSNPTGEGPMPSAPTAAVAPGPPDLKRVLHTQLCVTRGNVTGGTAPGHVRIDHPKMRAVCSSKGQQVAEMRFSYLGPTDHDEPLGSGEMRRQIGLKLRAANTCNVVYAMWRIEPESKLVVSVKSNPGMRTAAECSNHGYTNIKPRRSTPVPVLTPGATHTMRAQMDGEEVKVTVDGNVVWEGSVGPAALAFDGPVGLRTDNGRFDVEFFAGLSGDAPVAGPGCAQGGADEP